MLSVLRCGMIVLSDSANRFSFQRATPVCIITVEGNKPRW